MTDKVLVIPATFRVGSEFPAYLPLADGAVKPLVECTREEVTEAIEELRAMAARSRERLQQAYDEHVRDVEALAQVSAYRDRYAQWTAVREGKPVREILWSQPEPDDGNGQ